jgi:hypothetical protein
LNGARVKAADGARKTLRSCRRGLGGKGGSAKPVEGGPALFPRFVRYHRCPEGRWVRPRRTRDAATMAAVGGLGHDGGPIKGC